MSSLMFTVALAMCCCALIHYRFKRTAARSSVEQEIWTYHLCIIKVKLRNRLDELREPFWTSPSHWNIFWKAEKMLSSPSQQSWAFPTTAYPCRSVVLIWQTSYFAIFLVCLIESLVTSYIKKPSCLILLTVACKSKLLYHLHLYGNPILFYQLTLRTKEFTTSPNNMTTWMGSIQLVHSYLTDYYLIAHRSS